uniref:DUF5615 domain-containing protein n=1 Tax=Candidatus Kentrum sp. DK TaxID=2126562 RepID=A0A450S194_9GAMM|nr:MAG: hypothetical protein BECKDK2373C_GA0170839_10116 [Candidatus Kentron sp. DK]VFJ67132.1 MAG: hypothetical protein BECKDK2373B_GA0170837_11853 [Candidatus Kentron sp. DK]
MSDDEIIRKAFPEEWILITNDKDFGEKIYRENHPHHGVILLRLQNERPISKIHAVERLLEKYQDQLTNNFIVVTETLIRFGRSPVFHETTMDISHHSQAGT